jgi:hypothetical protein
VKEVAFNSLNLRGKGLTQRAKGILHTLQKKLGSCIHTSYQKQGYSNKVKTIYGGIRFLCHTSSLPMLRAMKDFSADESFTETVEKTREH